MNDARLCCPCDALVHPPKPDIPAGVSALARQLAGFPEFRRAMLREIPTHPPLAGWRAREGDDRGVMLVEMCAYVLDILAFYDERIANETYLGTAMRRPSLRRLVELIGYRPRPGLAASVVLAAIAEGPQPTLVPAGTAFRSGAFDGEPPQVFESSFHTVIEPKRNRWTIAPMRERAPGQELLFESGSATLRKDDLVLFRWGRSLPIIDNIVRISVSRLGRFSDLSDGLPFIAPLLDGDSTILSHRLATALASLAGSSRADLNLDLRDVPRPATLSFQGMVTGKVTAVETVRGRDGESYRRVRLEPEPQPSQLPELSRVEVLMPKLSAPLNANLAGASVSSEGLSTGIVLEGLYPQILAGSSVLIERGGEVRPGVVSRVQSTPVAISDEVDAAQLPATKIFVRPKLPAGWVSALRVHFEMVDAGRLTQVAKIHLVRDDVDGAALEPPMEPPETLLPDELLLHDAEERGEKVGGTVVVDSGDSLGRGRISLREDQGAFRRPLRTPVAVFGNLVAATRGESVRNEVLGGGDASQSFQSFKLDRKPLTYLADASAPDGRLSTLTVRVNGIVWKEVPSLFATGPEHEVYIVRQNDDEESVVTFGDGATGARLPTGVDNVVASYRFGVGAAKPPANSITQLARPTDGLRRVLNPVAAGGGRDADRPEDIRINAPASALTLGRAISLLDFEALAYDFGVVNAHATWAWDEASQRAVTKLWFIAEGGDIADELRRYLIGQADPHIPLEVCEAVPVESRLVIDLEVDPRHDSDAVEASVMQALGDPEIGLLALQNVPIGGPLFRSRIFSQVLSVDGVVSVRSMTLDGRPVEAAITVEERGHYRNLLSRLRVGNSAAGDVLLALASPPLPSAVLTAATLRRLPATTRATTASGV